MADEIVISGAGPAGVLTAILLARRGYRVVLLAGGRNRPRIEGLSQRVVDVLLAHRLMNAAATVGPQVPRMALWNDEHGPRNTEYATERASFDTALLADAADAGVSCVRVRKFALDKRGEHLRVSLVTTTAEQRELTAGYFVEARGRAAPLPRAGAAAGPTTTALISPIVEGNGQAATCVESFNDGWAWYASNGQAAFLQIFVDSGDGLPKRAALRNLFEGLANRLVLAPQHIGSGRCRGAIRTRHATPRLARTLMGPNFLRVGDAASAVDPLSGHGVFEAFGSALAASAAIHTIVSTPTNAAIAKRFYEERTRLGFERFARVGRDFHRLETRWPERPFWRARASWPDDVPAHAAPATEPVRFERRPVVDEGLVVERRVAVTPDQPRGIWRIDGVPLANLVDRLQDHEGATLATCIPDIGADLNINAAQLATALDWLRARRVLAHGELVAFRDGAFTVAE